MENIVLAYLFFIGTCFGSFISVIVHRLPDYLKKGNAGIMNGRSQCGSCGKTLGWKELVPIFSWVFQGGRCSSCKKKIPFTYPALELVTGGLFAASAKYLCNLPLALSGDWSEISRVLFFLVVAFVTVTFVFYDIVYQEIPDEILVPATAIVGALLLLLPEGNSLFRHFEPVSWNGAPLGQGMNALFGAVAIYSFFYLQFLIPVGTFCLKNKRYKDALEVLGYYVYLPVAVLKDVSFRLVGKKPAVPEGDSGLEWATSWIGLWDLRIAVFMGFVGGAKIAGLGLFLAYIVGSVVGLYVLAVLRKRNMAIAFGPFLAIGLYASLFFYDPIVKTVLNFGGR